MNEPKNRHLKKQAYSIYRKALRDGTLIRAQECAKCGASDIKIEGHHTDYAYPVDVIWLCKKCHSEIHMSYANFWETSPHLGGGRPRIYADNNARQRAYYHRNKAKKSS